MNPTNRKALPENLQRTVFLSSFLLFLVVCAFILLKSVRDALFLSHYSPGHLAYFMAMNTAVTAVFATIYLSFQRKYPLTRIVQFSFCAVGIVTFAMWMNSSAESEPFAGVFYIWVGVIGTIAPVQAWSLVGSQLLTREAKSAIGYLSGGATLGAVAGGFLARLLAAHSPLPLIILMGGLIYLVAFLVSLLFQEADPSDQPGVTEAAAEPKPVRKSLIWLLLIVVALSTIVSAFIDFQFKAIAQRQMTSSGQLASFFGTFYGSLAALALVVQFLCIPFLMKRFRLSILATMMPVLLLCADVVFLFTRIFAATVTLRGLDEVLRHSTDRSSMELIYVAMPEDERPRIKGLIDTIGVRASEGTAAVLLIVFFSWRHWPVGNLIVLNAILLAAWSISVFFLAHTEYPKMLKDKIERKDIDLQKITDQLFSQDFYRYVPLILRHGQKDMVMNLLALLEDSDKRWFGRYLLIGLQREEEEIQWRCLQIAFDQDADLSAQVKPLLQDSSARIRREALHYMCLRSGNTDLVRPPMENEDLSFQVAALACPQKASLSPADWESMSRILRQAREEKNEEARMEIAHVLQYANPDNPAISIYRELLQDTSMEVRIAALKSIRHSKPQEIIADMLNLARHPEFRNELQSTLAAYGAMLLPYLSTLIESDAASPAKKKLALRIAADLGGLRAFDLMIQAAQHKSLHLRFQAIKALNRLQRKHSLEEKQAAVLELLEQEAEALNKESRLRDLLNLPPESLFNKVAAQRISWAYERIFRLLGLIYDPHIMHSAHEAWNSGDAERIDVSMELLDQTISPELREHILPLLEKKAEAAEATEPEKQSRYLAVGEYLQAESPLPAAAAIQNLSDQEILQWRELLEQKTEKAHALILETLRWRIKMMDEKENDKEHPLTTLQKLETLSKISLFAQLGPQELLLLADQSTETQLPAGTILFEKGDPARNFYCVISGRVEMKSAETVALLGPGECIGLSDILRDQPRILSASARTDCFALVLTQDSFWEILDDYSSITNGLIRMLAEQVDMLTERIASRGQLLQG